MKETEIKAILNDVCGFDRLSYWYELLTFLLKQENVVNLYTQLFETSKISISIEKTVENSDTLPSLNNNDRQFLELAQSKAMLLWNNNYICLIVSIFLGFRQCSFCGIYVERRIGCGLITCRCGNRFCFYCGQKKCSCPGIRNHNYMPSWFVLL